MEAAPQQQQLAAQIASSSAEEREAAYAAIERSVASSHARSGGGRAAAAALAVACARPMLQSVLCAPASRVGAEEYVRAATLLIDMHKVDVLAVSTEAWRHDENALPLVGAIFVAPDTALAAVLAKEEWTQADAILCAVAQGAMMPLVAAGIADVLAAAGAVEADFRTVLKATQMYCIEPADRYLPLALLCLELVRFEEHPETVLFGAGIVLLWTMSRCPPNAKAMWEAGALDVIAASLLRFNPIERVHGGSACTSFVPSALWAALKELVESGVLAGIEVVQPLLDAGLADAAVSAVTAYQMLGNPKHASPCSLCYGALQTLERLLATPRSQAEPIVSKLRSAGVAAIRFLIDNPLVVMRDNGVETGIQATRIAALVW